MFDILGVKIEKIDEELIAKFRKLALEKLYYTESELALVSDHTLINKFKGKYLIYSLFDSDTITCPECHGAGEVDSGCGDLALCSCGGSGEITEKVYEDFEKELDEFEKEDDEILDSLNKKMEFLEKRQKQIDTERALLKNLLDEEDYEILQHKKHFYEHFYLILIPREIQTFEFEILCQKLIEMYKKSKNETSEDFFKNCPFQFVEGLIKEIRRVKK